MFDFFIKQKEKTAKEKKTITNLEQIENMVKILPDAVIIIDLAMRIIKASNQAIKLCGCKTSKELISKNLLELIVKQDQSVVKENIKKAIKGDLAQDIEAILVKSASTASLNISVVNDENKKPAALIITLRDITDYKNTIRNLKESEKKFQTIIENAPMGIYYIDFNGVFLYGNKKAEETVGYKRNEILGKSFLKLKLLDSGEMARAIKTLAINRLGKATSPGELILNKKDGTKVTLEINTEIVSIDGKKVILGIFNDITQRKKADKELAKSEEKYRMLFENTEEGIVLLDTKGNIIDINSALVNISGYHREEVIGKNILIFVKRIGLKVSEIISKFKKTFTSKTTEDFEFSILNKKKQKIIIRVWAYPIKKDNKIINIIGVIEDITKKKLAQKILIESEEKYRSMFEHSNDLLVILDSLGKIINANQKAEELFGYKKEEIINKNISHFVPAKYYPAALKCLAMDFAGKQSPILEVEIENKKGNLIPIEFASGSVPIYKEKRMIGAMYVGRDLTERKKSEKTLRESEEKFKLIAENTNDYICVVNLQGNFTYLSPSYKYIGYDPQKFIGKSVFKYMHPEDRLKMMPLLKKYARFKISELFKMKKEEQYQYLEFRYLDKKNNVWNYNESNANFVRKADGTAEIVIISRIVTERKKMEEKLKSAYKLNKDIIEKSPFGIYIINKKGIPEYVNKAMLTISNDSKENFLKINFLTFSQYKQISLTEKIKQGLKGKYFTVGPIKYTSHFGKKTTFRNFIGIPVKEFDKRKLVIIVEDITKIKKTEQELLTLTEKLDQKVEQRTKILKNLQAFSDDIVKNAPIGICIINKQGVIKSLNPAMIKLLDIKKDSVILGLNVFKMKIYKKTGMLPYFKQCLSKGKSFELENDKCVCYRTHQKRIRHYKGVPVKNEKGEVIRLLLLVEDITEKKKTGEKLKKLYESQKKQSKAIVKRQIELTEAKKKLEDTCYELREAKDKLQKQGAHLEEEVIKRTKELNIKIDETERFNKIAIGREVKMITLKKEIEKLKERIEKK